MPFLVSCGVPCISEASLDIAVAMCDVYPLIVYDEKGIISRIAGEITNTPVDLCRFPGSTSLFGRDHEIGIMKAAVVGDISCSG